MRSLTYIIIILLLLPVCRIAVQHNFTTEKGTISFFSEAPVADVDARNDNVSIVAS